MGAGEAELVTKKIAQQEAWLDASLIADAVHGNRDLVRRHYLSSRTYVLVLYSVARAAHGRRQHALGQDLYQVAPVGLVGMQVGGRIDRGHGGLRGGGGQCSARRLPLESGFDRRQAEGGRAHVAESEADLAADAGVERQYRAGGYQREIALALADLLERPAVTLGRDRHADLHEEFVRLERGLEVAFEEVVGRDRPLARRAARDQGRADEVGHQRQLGSRIVMAQT